MNVLLVNPAVRRATECGNERYLLGSGSASRGRC